MTCSRSICLKKPEQALGLVPPETKVLPNILVVAFAVVPVLSDAVITVWAAKVTFILLPIFVRPTHAFWGSNQAPPIGQTSSSIEALGTGQGSLRCANGGLSE